MRISDWSSDVCSSDLENIAVQRTPCFFGVNAAGDQNRPDRQNGCDSNGNDIQSGKEHDASTRRKGDGRTITPESACPGFPHPKPVGMFMQMANRLLPAGIKHRSEEHTSELQSIMRT